MSAKLLSLVARGATFTTRSDTYPAGTVYFESSLLVWAIQGAEDQHHVHAERGIELREISADMVEIYRGREFVGTFELMDEDERARFFWPAWERFLGTPGAKRWREFFAREVEWHLRAVE